MLAGTAAVGGVPTEPRWMQGRAVARGSDHGLGEKPFPACSVVAVGTGPQLGLTAGLARSCPVTVPAKPPTGARRCIDACSAP